jgi:hypothetical protein
MSSAGLHEELGPIDWKTDGVLLFIPEKIAYPDDGIYLLLRESRQQIPPN